MSRSALYDSSYRQLTHEEELSLAASIHAGYEVMRRRAAGEPIEDPNDLLGHARWARDKLMRHHLRLVASVARQYRSTGVPLVDLFYAGIRGLERAVQQYKPRRGHRFKTHATYWIHQAVQEAIVELGGAAPIQPSNQLEMAIRAYEVNLSTRERDLLIEHFGLFGQQPRSLIDLGAAYRLPPRVIQRQIAAVLEKLRTESGMVKQLRVERRRRMSSRGRGRSDAVASALGAGVVDAIPSR